MGWGDLPEVRGVAKEDLLADFAEAISNSGENEAAESRPPALISSPGAQIPDGDVKKARERENISKLGEKARVKANGGGF